MNANGFQLEPPIPPSAVTRQNKELWNEALNTELGAVVWCANTTHAKPFASDTCAHTRPTGLC